MYGATLRKKRKKGHFGNWRPKKKKTYFDFDKMVSPYFIRFLLLFHYYWREKQTLIHITNSIDKVTKCNAGALHNSIIRIILFIKFSNFYSCSFFSLWHFPPPICSYFDFCSTLWLGRFHISKWMNT